MLMHLIDKHVQSLVSVNGHTLCREIVIGEEKGSSDMKEPSIFALNLMILERLVLHG